jgi:hypothetical protein
MDDERWSPGMPVLQRQPVREPRPQPNLPPSLQGLPPRSVPETAPTPLQPYYINLSVIVFLCGLIAISALELGAGFGNPLVKLAVLIGGPLLIVATADVALRSWRSARAWMPVNLGRAWFRVAWVAMAGILIVLSAGAIVLVVLA